MVQNDTFNAIRCCVYKRVYDVREKEMNETIQEIKDALADYHKLGTRERNAMSNQEVMHAIQNMEANSVAWIEYLLAVIEMNKEGMTDKWMSVEEYKEAGNSGLCWIVYEGNISITAASRYITKDITAVMPIIKPELPEQE